jgi:proteasome lid subunit RPN8/RPN11
MTRSVADAIVAQAAQGAPLETCGYLGESGGTWRMHVPLVNIDRSPEHFSFAPAEQFQAVKAIRAAGLKPTGVYHSHPATPARPSQEDIRLGLDPSVSYVIVSLAGPQPDIRGFRIVEGAAQELSLEIVAEP